MKWKWLNSYSTVRNVEVKCNIHNYKWEINQSILISLFLIHHLQGSFAQINNTSIDQLENTTTITTEDSIVEDKLEKSSKPF